MDDETQTVMESKKLMNLLHYQSDFALCGTPCLWAFIPPSLHTSLCLFSPSELIMRELYRPRHISVFLPHNTNNRGYHERRDGRIVCTPSRNTRSLFGVCRSVLCFHHLCILGWNCAVKRASVRSG